MMENLNQDRSINPYLSVLLFIATVVLGFTVIGPMVGVFLALPFYPGNVMDFAKDITGGVMKEEIKIPFHILQASATTIGLIALPILDYQFIGKMKPRELFGKNTIILYGLSDVAVIAFMFPNSLIIEWNSKINFNGAFWDWAREREDVAEKFTKFLTQFDTGGEFLLGFLAIAILPAIGEEFAFRGWLQPAIQKIAGNPHIAIWFSAMIFSAFHFQFFGFVPRMLLGAMFGYFMYWSNNLWVPIVAHFVNNGFTVLIVYLNQLKIVEFDAESTEALPLQYVIPFAAVFFFLMYYVKKLITTRE
jgi:membrane protease YdiL (CAAX protease family)